MNRAWLVGGCVCALSVSNCLARIGDKAADLDVRFGAPTKVDNFTKAGQSIESRCYTFQGFDIATYLLAGACVGERIERQQNPKADTSEDKLAKLTRPALTQDEINYFLSLEGAEVPWMPIPSRVPGWRAWERLDKKLVASFLPGTTIAGGLSIDTRQFDDILNPPDNPKATGF